MTSLKLLLHDYYLKYHAFPPLTFLSKTMHVSIDKIVKRLDFFVNRGVLKKQGGEYLFNLIRPQNTPPTNIEKPIIEKKDGAFLFVRIAMGTIAGIAMIMSSYYSAIWFTNFLPAITSWICACVIVFYASFSIQASTIVNGKIIKTLLRITAVITILFSIVSTIAGQYRHDTEKQVYNDSKSKTAELKLMQNEEAGIIESIDSTKKELDDTTRRLSEFKKGDMESKGYKNLFYRAYTLRELRKKYEKQLSEIRKSIRNFMKTEKNLYTESNTFYDWLAEFLPFNPATIEFWLYLMPAIFYDLISPLGLHVALKKKERKE